MPPGFRPAIAFHKTSLYCKKIHRLQPATGPLFFGAVWGFFDNEDSLQSEIGEGRSFSPTPGNTPFPERAYSQQEPNALQSSYVSRGQRWLASCPPAVNRKVSPEVAMGWARSCLLLNKLQLLFIS